MILEVYEYKTVIFIVCSLCILLGIWLLTNKKKSGLFFLIMPFVVWLAAGNLFVWKIDDTAIMHIKEEQLVFDALQQPKSSNEVTNEREEKITQRKEKEALSDKTALIRQQKESDEFLQHLMSE